ncbi:MAG: PilZ domain-containing protein [Thermodesulfovibrionales bacterium]|nr:PilZ domain-containing protein [Thermodesulfovibrionales bacterium]
MEKRHFKRIRVNLKAERISGNEKYAVFIENISESGIYMLTTTSNDNKKYAPGTEIELSLKLSTGETIHLRGRTKWAYYKMPPDGLTDNIGLEIIDPPQEYISFVRALY